MPLAARPQFDWRLRTRTLTLGPRTLIMGILNATPDSFSDGGRFVDPRVALTQALQMLDDGADILDLGGESTRPNATAITPAEEQTRALPILRAIIKVRPEATLSIDTYHAETARLAIEAGAEIVNDVSGFLWDDAMAATCASLNCGVVLMHTRGRPQQWRSLPALAPADVAPLVLRELSARIDAALAARIHRNAIVIDPGFGFGKMLDENFPLLSHLDALHTLGFPLLAGLSRKGFLRRIKSQDELTTSGAPHLDSEMRESSHKLPTPATNPGAESSAGDPKPALSLPKGLASETLVPTTAANTAAILAGAHILRVHDVRPAREAADIADRILNTETIPT